MTSHSGTRVPGDTAATNSGPVLDILTVSTLNTTCRRSQRSGRRIWTDNPLPKEQPPVAEDFNGESSYKGVEIDVSGGSNIQGAGHCRWHRGLNNLIHSLLADGRQKDPDVRDRLAPAMTAKRSVKSETRSRTRIPKTQAAPTTAPMAMADVLVQHRTL